MGPSGGKTDAAQKEAERQEQLRQQRISAGRNAIDDAFAPFNDSFYSGAQQEVLDYYNPQVDRGYDRAQDQARLRLASTGNLEGTYGAQTMADLLSAYNTQRSDVADQASNRAAELRANTATAKADLYEQNRAAADPSAAASAAAGHAAQLQLPFKGSPLANVFRDTLDRTAQGITASSYGLPGLGAFYGSRPSNSSSSTNTTTRNKSASVVETS